MSCPPICPLDQLVGFTTRLNVYHRVRVTIHRVLSLPVGIALQTDSYHYGDVSSYHLVRMTQNRHVFSAPHFQDFETTSSLANARFITSTPGVDRNPYRYFGFVIILVIVRSFRSVSFRHMEMRESLARPRLAALYLIASFSTRIHSLCQNDSTYRSSSSGVWIQPG